jgi:hypothetical protein
MYNVFLTVLGDSCEPSTTFKNYGIVTDPVDAKGDMLARVACM